MADLKTNVITALKTSLEMLARPDGWIKNAWARNKDGNRVEPHSEDATCWCIEGAFMGASHYMDNPEEVQRYCVALTQVANKEIGGSIFKSRKIMQGNNSMTRIDKHSIIPSINDNPQITQKDIIKYLRNAIHMAEVVQWK